MAAVVAIVVVTAPAVEVAPPDAGHQRGTTVSSLSQQLMEPTTRAMEKSAQEGAPLTVTAKPKKDAPASLAPTISGSESAASLSFAPSGPFAMIQSAVVRKRGQRRVIVAIQARLTAFTEGTEIAK